MLLIKQVQFLVSLLILKYFKSLHVVIMNSYNTNVPTCMFIRGYLVRDVDLATIL